MNRLHLLLVFFALILGSQCTSTKTVTGFSNELESLSELMQGSFYSTKQAKVDSNYYDISLHMYPIWETEKTAKWLYVEQALTTRQEKPYRQRVYKLEQVNKTTFKSTIYKLPNEKLYIGKWKDKTNFDKLKPADLELRDGCAVLLKKKGKDEYKGATGVGTCKSTLRGADYATSIVEVYRDKIISWDQGFDKEGKQVWGAVKSGYIFER